MSSKQGMMAVAAAAAGLSVIVYVRSRTKRSLHRSARKQAAAPSEYHISLHRRQSSSEHSCTLIRLPKSADFAALQRAVGEALQLNDEEVSTLAFFPVLRAGKRPTCGKPLSAAVGLASFESILAQQPAEYSQMIELLCTPESSGSACVSPPPPPQPFATPGAEFPLIGHSYRLLGPEDIFSYNITNSVFPPNAAEYPYGSVLRFATGVMADIEDFPEGTVFHPEARSYNTMVADADVVEELLARSADFPKLWNRGPQKKLQEFTGNGLFTSGETSDDWQTAHSVLPRGFNQIKIKSFAPQIMAKTRVFIREWSAFPAGHTVKDVNHWLTAMTADAVVTCSMGLDMRNVERMGSGEPPHPFIDNFRTGLGYFTGGLSTKSEYGWKRFLPFFGAGGKLKKKYLQAKKDLDAMVDQMVERTRAGDLTCRHSIIQAMLDDKAANGQHVRYSAITSHIINLMIAGHETTAATLGFTLQLLAENPEYQARALEEVKRVLGDRTEPEVHDVPHLQFVEQCFREALRLYSPVTGLTRDVAFDTLLNGHRVFQGERISVMTRALHTNPKYWGGEFGDPYSYNPDRFSPEAVKNRHPNAYHPWGFGNRACIGSQFALFEAKTFLASMLLHFSFVPVPGYKLRASADAGGAAPSPHQLELTIFPRPGGPLCARDGSMLRLPPLAPEAVQTDTFRPMQKAAVTDQPGAAATGVPMWVLFGSNAGASHEFASQTAEAAQKVGFAATVTSLDQALQDGVCVPDGKVIVIVTSTYNGKPPDNAAKFKTWLASQPDGSLSGLCFAVFGLGNSQWQTYQQFPREVDAALERCGAQRLARLGACDVDGATFESDFEDWLAALVRTVGGAAVDTTDEQKGAPDDVEDAFVVVKPGSFPGSYLHTDSSTIFEELDKETRAYDKQRGEEDTSRFRAVTVAQESRELCQSTVDRSVRHVTLRLAEEGCTYRAGDHLEVLPPNSSDLVQSVLSALRLDGAATVQWKVGGGPRVKNNRSARDGSHSDMIKYVTAELVVGWFPDLAAVPSRKVLTLLSRVTADGEAASTLQTWGSDAEAYKQSVAAPKLCVAEILARYSGKWSMSLGQLCSIVKPIAPRYYSISSSPSTSTPLNVTVTVGQVQFTTTTGRLHHGLASTHLGHLAVGQTLPACVRRFDGNFHMPQDSRAPVIMVGPGTGIAPMMGFLQERATRKERGETLGLAVLFFGCRSRDEDFIYKEELEQHLKSGVLSELHVAFSREGAQKVYVQDLIFDQRQSVWKLLQEPTSCVYICGDARSMAPSVRKAFQRVAEDVGGKSGASAEQLMSTMSDVGRYVEDVWAN